MDHFISDESKWLKLLATFSNFNLKLLAQTNKLLDDLVEGN